MFTLWHDILFVAVNMSEFFGPAVILLLKLLVIYTDFGAVISNFHILKYKFCFKYVQIKHFSKTSEPYLDL